MIRMDVCLSEWLHPVPQSAPRSMNPIGAAESVSWAGMALPLAACAAIWGIGNSSPEDVAWLSTAHGVIGTAAFAWTVLRLVLRRRELPASRKGVAAWPGPSLLVLYALLGLQPLLALAASMLHGDNATLFGIPLPSVLPTDPQKALEIDRLHGVNALLLLGLIAMQVREALRILRHRSAR